MAQFILEPTRADVLASEAQRTNYYNLLKNTSRINPSNGRVKKWMGDQLQISCCIDFYLFISFLFFVSLLDFILKWV